MGTVSVLLCGKSTPIKTFHFNFSISIVNTNHQKRLKTNAQQMKRMEAMVSMKPRSPNPLFQVESSSLPAPPIGMMLVAKPAVCQDLTIQFGLPLRSTLWKKYKLNLYHLALRLYISLPLVTRAKFMHGAAMRKVNWA